MNFKEQQHALIQNRLALLEYSGGKPFADQGRCHCGNPGLYRVETRDRQQVFFCTKHRHEANRTKAVDGYRFKPNGALTSSEASVRAARRAQRKRITSGSDLETCPLCPAELSGKGMGTHMVQRHGITLQEYRKSSKCQRHI